MKNYYLSKLIFIPTQYYTKPTSPRVIIINQTDNKIVTNTFKPASDNNSPITQKYITKSYTTKIVDKQQ